jgi:uncharacterized damage-inducible protein DinB
MPSSFLISPEKTFMTAKDAIRKALHSNQDMLKSFLGDLSDADLLVRPVPTANHIAWQLGHLIAAEAWMQSMIPGTTPISLPDGFDDKHKKETANVDSPAAFLKKAEYLELLDKVRAGTLAALDNLSDADLDIATTGRVASFAPDLGTLLLLIGSHTMMHGGQFTVLRRKLGKPVLF